MQRSSLLSIRRLPRFAAFLACTAALGQPAPAASSVDQPVAIPTFECIGLYWKPQGASADNECKVAYRAAGEINWREAMPLWFDPTEHPGVPEHSLEYRGSIVNLKPATQYEIRLKLTKTGTETALSATTWDENFPIAKTVHLKAADATQQPLAITEGGSQKGYVLYTPEPGQKFELDGGDQAEANVTVSASYVILRGLTLKGAKNHGIVLNDVHDVVIEKCDISGWGQTAQDGWGVNMHSALFSKSAQLERIVVQNCRMHDPRSNSNTWSETRVKADGKTSAHPVGPQGISFFKSRGNLVIRNNEIFGDLDHKFNDGMGEHGNFSFGGFPNRDSDIYGNRISNVADDGIESEGANMNVRVWNNVINETYGAIGCASTSLGPIYIWRNVMGTSRKGVKADADGNRGAYLVKIGNENQVFTLGKIYILHNTMLQPPPREGFTETSGGSIGIIFTSPKKLQSNITSRNNIFFTRKPESNAIRDTQKDPTNDYDYDLYSGTISAGEGNEVHGVKGSPQFQAGKDSVALAPGSPGIDAGVRLPNFNDDFAGAAPDMGASESPGVSSAAK